MWGRRNEAASSGQAIVEFAFVVIILTMLLGGALEVGRAVSARIQITNMARAAAQYGTIAEFLGVSAEEEIRAGMVQAALDDLGGSTTIYGIEPVITASAPALNEAGECIARATVTYSFQPLLGIPIAFDGLEMSRSSEMRVLFIPPDMCIPAEASP